MQPIPEVKTEEVDVAAAKVSELVLLLALTAAVGARGKAHVAADPATHRLPRDAQLPRDVRRVRAGPRQLKIGTHCGCRMHLAPRRCG